MHYDYVTFLNNVWNLIFKEGPHSALCDEEFYDAVETGLDKIEEENQLRDRLKQKSVSILTSPTTASTHRLWPEVIILFTFCISLILSEFIIEILLIY